MKIMKIIKKAVFIFAATLFLCSCKENSPLSDVELNNPGLVSPEITLSKHKNELGITNTSLKVYLNDKNNNSINLLKGSIELNNQPLGVHTEISGAPYYSFDNIQLVPKRKYQFDIKMADDKVYPCSIYSPEKSIGEFDVPEYHDRNTSLIVSWDKINIDDTECLIEIEGELGSEEIVLSTSQMKAGTCFITPALFNIVNKGEMQKDVLITLRSINYGKVDPRFNGGSIKIIESVSRQVSLGDGDFTKEDEKDYEAYRPK